jgi:crotonobetainyl-CoA:carnitine CoA-transferase CaiB-like acyl-CoA transferase
MTSALGHLTVLDLSEIISGQYCSRMLADFGADVILVEPPEGTVIRRMGPFRKDDGVSQLFLHLNLGKRSIVLDPKSPDGWKRLLALVAKADIVLVPLGLDRAALEAANPRAVIALVSDFGEDGPRAHWRGSEMIHQALSGVMFRNGRHDKEPLYGCGRRAYYATGVATYIAVLSAIYARGRTGTGQQVSIDVCETAASMIYVGEQYLYNGTSEPRSVPAKLPSASLPCRDTWVSVFIYAHHWKKTWEALGRPEVAADPRFVNVEERMQRWQEVVALLRETVADKTADEVVDALQSIGAIGAKSARPSDLLNSKHLAARNYWESIDGRYGQRRIMGAPFRLSATPRHVRSEAPELGQDDGVLAVGLAKAVGG